MTAIKTIPTKSTPSINALADPEKSKGGVPFQLNGCSS